MESKKLERLINENMKSIFGFALTRLNSVQLAEELASDIMYQIIKSANNLKDEDRFYGFMWKIAENTYNDYLRKKSKPINNTVELDEKLTDDNNSIEDEIIKKEEIRLLRRELSLLSDNYRKATVMFYVDEFSCSKIADLLNISTEMVKYYLFRARKIIREGMKMDRLFGEKSYNPTIFEIDFWGNKAGDDKEYNDFRNRKLKGNILLAAYYTPVTIQELSIELGVAVTYLEDEIKLLIDRQYLICKNDKYITNIPIFTSECTSLINQRIKKITKETAKELISIQDEFESKYGKKLKNENILRWHKLFLALHYALLNCENSMGDLPKDGPYSLVNGGGGKGVVWGRCVDKSVKEEDSTQVQGIYNGCISNDRRGSVIAINFAQIVNKQRFSINFTDPLVCTAVDCFEYLPNEWKNILNDLGYSENGKANFPVYSFAEYNDIEKVLEKSIAALSKLSVEISKAAADITSDFAPKHIKEYAEYVGSFIYSLNVAENIANELYEMEYLKMLEDDFKPAMCVIKSN